MPVDPGTAMATDDLDELGDEEGGRHGASQLDMARLVADMQLCDEAVEQGSAEGVANRTMIVYDE